MNSPEQQADDGDVTPRWLKLALNPLTFLLVYYVAMAGAIWLAVLYVPGFRAAVSATSLAASTDFLAGDAAVVASADPLRDTAFAMLGAFFIVVPVAITYVLTKQRTGYDESVVHTMVVLPLVVAGIVVIVRDSLALAFSLAGIVAAVRFRSTLEDTKDAVYVFIAVAIGIAAGVQALGVALLMSVIFNAVILLLWRVRFGNIYADQRRLGATLRASDVLVGANSAGATFGVGDPRLLAALSMDELRDVATRSAHLQKHIEASDSGSSRYNSVLLVHVLGIEPAQRAIEPILREHTQAWQLAEITPGRDSNSTIEYLLRVPDYVVPGALVDKLRMAGRPHVAAVEYKSLEGLKKRKKK